METTQHETSLTHHHPPDLVFAIFSSHSSLPGHPFHGFGGRGWCGGTRAGNRPGFWLWHPQRCPFILIHLWEAVVTTWTTANSKWCCFHFLYIFFYKKLRTRINSKLNHIQNEKLKLSLLSPGSHAKNVKWVKVTQTSAKCVKCDTSDGHAGFEQFHMHSIYEKASIKAFTKSGNMSLSPLLHTFKL